MKRAERYLWIVLIAEVCVAGFFGIRWWRDPESPALQGPAPPKPDLSTLHPVTRRDIAELRQLVIKHQTAESWQELGEALLLFGRFAESEQCLRQAVALDPDSYRAQHWWGIAFHQLGRPAEAIKRFRKAVSLAANSQQPQLNAALNWYAIGRNRLRQENPDEAESAFRRAGEFVPAQHQLLRLLIRTGRKKEALVLADRLVSRYPNEQSAYRRRAAARELAEDVRGADEDRRRIERCTEHIPDDVLISKLQSELKRFGLPRRIAECKSLFERGNPVQAANRLRPLLAEEWRPDIAQSLASMELRSGNFQQADDLLEVLFRRVEATPGILDLQAFAASRLGENSRALEIWTKAATAGDVESVHHNLAILHGNARRTTIANRHSSRAHFLSGRELLLHNRLQESKMRFVDATRLDSQFAHAWYWLAECHEALGERVEARKAYEACLKADPNHGRAIRALAREPYRGSIR